MEHERPSSESLLTGFDPCRQPGDYKRPVKIDTSHEILEEDGRREASSPKWKDKQDVSYIEDPWLGVWKADVSASRGLSQWPCTDELRRRLQYDLRNALISGPIEEKYVAGGLRATSCWITLIGHRHNDLYISRNFPDPSHSMFEAERPVAQVQILIECIWACNISRKATIGSVLGECYRRRVLLQPVFALPSKNEKSFQILRTHIRAVRVAIYLINVLYRQVFPGINENEDLDTAWSSSISEAEVHLRSKRHQDEELPDKSPFFYIGDLNLTDLQRLGRLQIRWTEYWDEHLELTCDGVNNSLKLYWFHPHLSKYCQGK